MVNESPAEKAERLMTEMEALCDMPHLMHHYRRLWVTRKEDGSIGYAYYELSPVQPGIPARNYWRETTRDEALAWMTRCMEQEAEFGAAVRDVVERRRAEGRVGRQPADAFEGLV